MAIEILTKNQLQVLNCIGKEAFFKQTFYLTGGTALAGFYLKHRLSEDLDFFSEVEFDVSAITIFFEKNRKQLGIQSLDFQQSFNRNLFFLHFSGDIVKTEFTYFPFPRIQPGQASNDFPIDSILDIAVNKLFTIYQRTRARDYIDLYAILQKYSWSIDELVQKAKIKFDWHIDYLQLGTQFMKAQEAIDLPRMIQTIPEQEWRTFFVQEAEKFRSKVLDEKSSQD